MNKQGAITRSVELNYNKNFKCVGNECSLTCCAGWDIHIDKKTYYLYKSNPEIIRHVSKLKGAQVNRNSHNFAKINLKPNRVCPMLDEDMLCSVQKKLGESALSKTCSTFPRLENTANGVTFKSLTLGCPEVVKHAIFTEKNINIETNIAKEEMNGSFSCMKAIIDYLQLSARPSWEKLIIISSSLKAADTKSRSSYFVLLELFKYMDEHLNSGQTEDPSIFQVESMYSLIATVRADDKHNSLNEIKKSAWHYINAKGQTFEAQIKQLVIARELLNRTILGKHHNWIDIIVVHELFKNQSKLLSDNSIIEDLFSDITLTSAIARFFVILNFGHSEFNMSPDAFAKTVALIYRKIGHNANMIEFLRQQIEKRFTDYHATSALLLA